MNNLTPKRKNLKKMFQLKLSDFPHKCIKCKRMDVELFPYPVIHKRTHHGRYITTTYSTNKGSVPVCSECNKGFKNFGWFALLTVIIGSIFMFGFLGSIVLYIIDVSGGFWSILTSLSNYAALVLFAPTIILLVINKGHPYNPSRYINVKGFTIDEIIIDPDYKQDIIDFQRGR